MTTKKGVNMKTILAVQVFLILAIGSGWVLNIYKLTHCDFEAPYKAEVLHGVGLFPLVGMVTGWCDFGE